MFGKKNVSDSKTAQELLSRQRILWMNPQSLLALMTSQRWVITENELPEDVIFHSVFWDGSRNAFGVVCISKEFKHLKMHESRPELPPIGFRYWNPAKDGIIE